MNKTKNIVVFRFAEHASAYQALSALKQLDDEPSAEVTAAMLVERQLEGAVQVPDGVHGKGRGDDMLLGGLVGSVLDMVGGSVGAVVGWGTGALVGGGADWLRVLDSSDLVALVADHVSAGSTVLVAEVTESDTAQIDLIAARFGAVVERRPAEQVRAEVKAVRDAQEAVERAAARARREQKKAEMEETIEARERALRQKFHHHAA